ncbi:MAG: elongation factor P [Chloroflexi bacterium]|nr:elongation factor P [Chloroflexota bacterium]
MIESGDIRKGMTVEMDGALYKILDFKHIKIGRGSAQVRMKLRNITEGHTIERTFQAGERFAVAHLERRTAQFLYRDGDLLYLMDTETFDQNPISTDLVKDLTGYLKEGMTLDIILHGDEPIGVELPTTVDLIVTRTDPGFKGNTAQGGTKPATLETDLTLNVPLFVNEGDTIKVDTRTGQYQERV